MTTYSISELRQRAEAAQRTFEEERGRLFRADGSKLFSDEAHEEQLATLRQGRNAVLEEVIENTREILQGTSAEIANLENRAPEDLLTPEELECANARCAFARDAAESLPPEVLAAGLESVLASGDKGSIFAHWMAGDRRRARILERRRDSASASDNPTAQNRVSASTELDDVLGRMRGALDEGTTAREIEAARECAREVSEVQGTAELARREWNVHSP